MIAPAPLGVNAEANADATEGLYLYPHPLTLARDHAEAERVRLADTAAYSEMCRTWGSLGGLTTLYRYGTPWYAALAARRWGKISAEVLAEQFEQFGGRS